MDRGRVPAAHRGRLLPAERVPAAGRDAQRRQRFAVHRVALAARLALTERHGNADAECDGFPDSDPEHVDSDTGADPTAVGDAERAAGGPAIQPGRGG
jgi:hypothetical protein